MNDENRGRRSILDASMGSEHFCQARDVKIEGWVYMGVFIGE